MIFWALRVIGSAGPVACAAAPTGGEEIDNLVHSAVGPRLGMVSEGRRNEGDTRTSWCDFAVRIVPKNSCKETCHASFGCADAGG